MKQIRPSDNKHRWPRHQVEAISARKDDLIIRIADWTHLPKDFSEGEPAYDVEVYIGGVYDWNESKCFALGQYSNWDTAKQAAVEFAQKQIAKLL